MRTTTIKFTKNDLAKYPFLKETQLYVKELDFKVEDIASPEFAKVLERAEERLQEAVLYAIVSRKTRYEEIEILSFPTAIMIAIATENSFVQKRYALAEAKQSFADLKDESEERLLALSDNFGWKLERARDQAMPQYEFVLHFTDYLRNITHLKGVKWKLVNKPLNKGKIYLSRDETARLLSEEVRRYVEKRLEIKDTKFPTKIQEAAHKIKELLAEKIDQTEIEGIPKTIQQEAFPPCIQALYKAFTSGHHLSHVGRFTLTSFLVNAGMSSETVIELYKNLSDFNLKMTRYQVEHIAGETGSRTKYKPPRCETLQTHGICTNPDELCTRAYRPLRYYTLKSKQQKTAN
jgi:DNA primase large subunit